MAPSLKLLTLGFFFSAATVGACGDNGNVIGTANDAGSAGQSGGDAGNAASGAAGNLSSAGNSAAGTAAGGGNATSGGSAAAGSGGKPACEVAECVRANVCLDKCGGKVVYTGCCACGTATVEEQSCVSAGGQGAGGQSAGSGQDCVGTTCSVGEACVAHRTVGGAIIPPSAGGCMSGKHIESNSCQNDFKYACAALTCAAPGPSCHCAPNTSCAYTTTCRLPQPAPWLDTDADLVCEQQAP